MNVLFIRHGEANWRLLEAKGVRGWARSFAPLTPLGAAQVEAIANDYRLHEADVIISSAYTRALESAARLNRHLGKPLFVEYDLHEWLPHKDSLADVDDDVIASASQQLVRHSGPGAPPVPPANARSWESLEEVRQRALSVLSRYQRHDTVIVVAHAVLISSVTGSRRHTAHAEIVPYTLTPEPVLP